MSKLSKCQSTESIQNQEDSTKRRSSSGSGYSVSSSFDPSTTGEEDVLEIEKIQNQERQQKKSNLIDVNELKTRRFYDSKIYSYQRERLNGIYKLRYDYGLHHSDNILTEVDLKKLLSTAIGKGDQIPDFIEIDFKEKLEEVGCCGFRFLKQEPKPNIPVISEIDDIRIIDEAKNTKKLFKDEHLKEYNFISGTLNVSLKNAIQMPQPKDHCCDCCCGLCSCC